jgi:hypothetical protein
MMASAVAEASSAWLSLATTRIVWLRGLRRRDPFRGSGSCIVIPLSSIGEVPVYLKGMNRRNLLQAAGLALLSLVPFNLLKAAPVPPKKEYLEYNEPYDRSLVKFTQDQERITGQFYWEPSPGEAPNCFTAITRKCDYRPDQFHEAMEVFLSKRRAELSFRCT